MLSCLVRCLKMAAKFDEFSISEIMAMLTVMRKFKNPKDFGSESNAIQRGFYIFS